MIIWSLSKRHDLKNLYFYSKFLNLYPFLYTMEVSKDIDMWVCVVICRKVHFPKQVKQFQLNVHVTESSSHSPGQPIQP